MSLMIFLHNHRKCIVNYVLWTQGKSFPPYRLCLWCIWVQGMGWQSLSPHNNHPYVMHSPIYLCAPPTALPCYNKLPWKPCGGWAFGFGKTRKCDWRIGRVFVPKQRHEDKAWGVHSLLYFAYMCVQDLFFGGLFTLQKYYKVMIFYM